MANELRVRANFLGGLVEDNPLTSGSATLTSAGLASVPAIGSTQHFPITLDPDGVGGAPEIIYITAHTAAATTATIVRGQESTTGRAHAQDTPWVHGPTAYDFVGSGAKASRSAAYTIAGVAVPWDAEEYDYDSYHDNVTNNTRLTVPTPGLYLVGASIATGGPGSNPGRLIIDIKKNGTAVLGGRCETEGTASGQYPAPTVSVPSVCSTAGDYFEVVATATATSPPLDTSLAAFWIVRLSR